MHFKCSKSKVTRASATISGLMTWAQASTAEGKTYYFNAATGESRWDRPADYQPSNDLPPAARSSAGSLPAANVYGKTVAGGTTSTANVAASWRELVTQAGKKYYYNEVTKVSVWEMPADYKGTHGD